MLRFRVDGQNLKRLDKENVASGASSFPSMAVACSGLWTQGAKTAIFTSETGSVYNVLLNADDTCKVPAEVLNGEYFKVSLYNTYEDQRITTNEVNVLLDYSGFIGGLTPKDPTPDVYAQILDRTGKNEKAIEQETKDRKAEVDFERQRINQIIALPDGSTTADAELTDIRLGGDGTKYPTAGEAVRGQVSDLNQALYSDFFTQSPNMYNPDSSEFGCYYETDGTRKTNNSYLETGYMEFKTGDTFYTNVAGFACVAYDSDKNFIASWRTTSLNSKGYTEHKIVEQGVSYVRIALSVSQSSSTWISKKAMENYLPYTGKVLNQSVSIPKLNKLSNDVSNFIVVSPNMYDQLSVETGGYYETDGTKIGNSNYVETDFLPFVYGETVYTNLTGTAFISLDSDKNFVSGWRTGSAGFTSHLIEDENVCYIRAAVNVSSAYNGTVWISKEPMTAYEPYDLHLNENVNIGKKSISRLVGKEVIFDGDSITEGYPDSDGHWVTYPDLVQQMYGCNSTNLGKSGRGFCCRDQRDDGKKTIVESIKSYTMDGDFSGIIHIAAGVNDFINSTPLGSEDDRDVGTFYGALTTSIETVMNNYPLATIIFSTPIHYLRERIPNEQGLLLIDYVDAMLNRLKWYGAITNNMYDTFGYNPHITNVQKMLFDWNGLHPYTEKGMEFMSVRIGNFIESQVY